MWGFLPAAFKVFWRGMCKVIKVWQFAFLSTLHWHLRYSQLTTVVTFCFRVQIAVGNLVLNHWSFFYIDCCECLFVSKSQKLKFRKLCSYTNNGANSNCLQLVMHCLKKEMLKIGLEGTLRDHQLHLSAPRQGQHT